jgi:hypothetical protein
MAVTELRDRTDRENPKPEIPSLSALTINGATPFWSHGDGAQQRLSEAYAILTLLRGAHNVCEEAGDSAADAFANIRHEIKGCALEGIGTLIALAQYHLDCADAERKQREVRHG